MGKQNSSRTRVVPVFDALMDKDPSGRTWLAALLGLGSRSAGQVDATAVGPLLPDHPRSWGNNERRLDPPKGLLHWLVANCSAPTSDTLWGGASTRAKRERLIAKDLEVVAEAHRLLEEASAARRWYVLEGPSWPDACLVTDALFVVVEGKRTERKATATTTWMRARSQMLRHMDAAWEVRDGRRVLGLMIVEGLGGADPTVPSDHWLKQAGNQVLEPTLSTSLPHRTRAERNQIASGFLGATTWQRVCAEFGLPWPPCGNAGEGSED